MEASFWQRRWENNEILFHELEVNPLLTRYFERLALAPGKRIFLPLCGKTLDIGWLLAKGYRIAGAELVEKAVIELFAELGVTPDITQTGGLKHYSYQDLDIFCGDIFDLSRKQLGPVDAIYDRAALVALPELMRQRYSVHLREITESAPQLLICHEYDQTLLDGPPFSIASDALHAYYQASYDLSLLESRDVEGGLKGKCPAKENVWLLRERTAPSSTQRE